MEFQQSGSNNPDTPEEGVFYTGHRCQVNLLRSVDSVKTVFLLQTMCHCADTVYMSRYSHFL